MPLRSARLLSLTICLLAFASLLTAKLSAQQPKVPAPHKPVAPLATLGTTYTWPLSYARWWAGFG